MAFNSLGGTLSELKLHNSEDGNLSFFQRENPIMKSLDADHNTSPRSMSDTQKDFMKFE